MEDQQIDHSRRRFLVAATSVIGAGGLAAAAVPFIGSMNPSEKVAAAGAPSRWTRTRSNPAP